MKKKKKKDLKDTSFVEIVGLFIFVFVAEVIGEAETKIRKWLKKEH